MGVADKMVLPDSKMTASSTYSGSYLSYYGRFNENRGAARWCPKTTSNRNDYLQVDLGSLSLVCAIATQGTMSHEYTTSYKVWFSVEGVTWKTYKVNNYEKVI